MIGYIKLHRQITENEFWLSERFSKAQAWIDLLLLAGFSKKTVFIRGVEINLQPGELCWSQKSLAVRWKWNFKTVITFLNQLQKREMVECRKNNITSIIRIINWDFYQGNGLQNGTQNGVQMERKTETNKKNKKGKKGNKQYSPNSNEFRLSVLLYELIKGRNPNYKKPDLQKWSQQIDLMIRLDNREPAEIEKVIRWVQSYPVQSNGFTWANNILSTQKLREKFDRLMLEINTPVTKKEKDLDDF